MMPGVRLIDANAAADKIMRETEAHADEIGVGGVALMIGFARALRDEVEFPTIDAQPVWIPCSERMPENGQKCIVCMADKSIRFGVWCGDFDSWGVWEINKKLYRTITVPYWMPLPEQPKGGKQE